MSSTALTISPLQATTTVAAAESVPLVEPLRQEQDFNNGSLQKLPVQRKLSVGAAEDLHRTADQIMRMRDNAIQRKCDACEEEEEQYQHIQRKPFAPAQTDSPYCPKDSLITSKDTFVQFKLTIGAPDDALEREADSVADSILMMPEVVIQRKCAECAEDEGNVRRKPSISFIQKYGDNTGNTSSQEVSSQINATKGHGSPMPENTRSFMEDRFGSDFSGVNIHTGDYAVRMSQELNAQAFTVGSDIYFDTGKFSPESDSGKRLLAHELTHTIQQGEIGSSTIRRSCNREIGPRSGCIMNSGDIYQYGSSSENLYRFSTGCDDFLTGESARLTRTISAVHFPGVVHVHGFASEEGNADFNIRLSCARAQAAANLLHLHHPQGSSLRFVLYAHGATPGGRPDHRSVVISSPSAAPTPPPPPPPRVVTPTPRTRPRRTLLEQCQDHCVRRLGGCADTRSGGNATPEEIHQYNLRCSEETHYSGPDITPGMDDCGSSPISIVEVIPDIMAANRWTHGQRVLEEWLTNPTGGGTPDTSSITMSWILGFPEARSVYDSIFADRVYANAAAQAEICRLVSRLGISRGGTLDYSSLPITQLDPPARGTPNYSVNFRRVDSVGITGGLTDLSAALGNFIFKVLVGGSVDSTGLVTINSVGVYVKDSFDFDGEQPLGCWNPCDNDVGRITCGAEGVSVSNRTFRDWRAGHGQGGDFMIYSDIMSTTLPAPVTFRCP